LVRQILHLSFSNMENTSEVNRLNTPNGSWGVVQIQPTPKALLLINTPNGSWGIFQILASKPSVWAGSEASPNSRRGYCGDIFSSFLSRLNLNNPPTAETVSKLDP